MRSLALSDNVSFYVAITLIALLGLMLWRAISGWISEIRLSTQRATLLKKASEERDYWYSTWRKLSTAVAVCQASERSVNTAEVTPVGDLNFNGSKTQPTPPERALTQVWRNRKPQ